MDKPVYLYTDSTCEDNPSAGGWGIFIRYGTHGEELFDDKAETTNSRMKLTAVIEGLRSLECRCRVAICTNLQYTKNGMGGQTYGWKKNDWKTATKKPVKNGDL